MIAINNVKALQRGRTDHIVRTLHRDVASVVGNFQTTVSTLQGQVESYNQVLQEQGALIHQLFAQQQQMVLQVKNVLQAHIESGGANNNNNLLLAQAQAQQQQQQPGNNAPAAVGQQQQQQPPIQQQNHSNDNNQTGVDDGVDDLLDWFPVDEEQEGGGVPVAGPIATAAGRQQGVPQGNQRGIVAARDNLRFTATQYLVPGGIQPKVDVAFPKSWMQLVEEWEDDFLESFVPDGQKVGWETSKEHRFSNRYCAMKQLRRRKEELKTALLSLTDREVAFRLDAERRGMRKTLTQHVRVLKQGDTNQKKRSKPTNDGNNNKRRKKTKQQ